MNQDSFVQAIRSGTLPSIAVKELGGRGRKVVYVAQQQMGSLIDRKSRVLRKDAEAFVGDLTLARAHFGEPLQGVLVVQQAPLCSQARAWLEDQGVIVVHLPQG